MHNNEDQRIIRLEEKISYMQDTIDQLDQVVYDLNRKISQMQKQIAEINLDKSPTDPKRNEADEKPPHWGGFGSAAL